MKTEMCYNGSQRDALSCTFSEFYMNGNYLPRTIQFLKINLQFLILELYVVCVYVSSKTLSFNKLGQFSPKSLTGHTYYQV
jgi:hypothetical protein